jgi:hypothetical protein
MYVIEQGNKPIKLRKKLDYVGREKELKRLVFIKLIKKKIEKKKEVSKF